jgi:transposase
VDQGGLFSYVSMEQRVPTTHPLRRVRALLDEALDSMSPAFDVVYAEGGRDSVAPERLVRALVLQVLYSIRSERLLVEQLDYNLLFRWFVGLSMDERRTAPAPAARRSMRVVLVVVPNLDRALHIFHALGVTGDGHGSVNRLLAMRATAQPHDAILVGVNAEVCQTREVLRRQFGLDLGRDN